MGTPHESQENKRNEKQNKWKFPLIAVFDKVGYEEEEDKQEEKDKQGKTRAGNANLIWFLGIY